MAINYPGSIVPINSADWTGRDQWLAETTAIDRTSVLQAMQGIQGVGGAYANAKPALEQMIGARLRLPYGGSLPFDKLVCHELADKRVVVFVCQGDQATIIYDEADLFPSDTLMTQLRMIKG